MASPVSSALLEMAAVDNGFDLRLHEESGWLAFASTRSPLRVWLSSSGETSFSAAFSKASVSGVLAEFGSPLTLAPPAAVGGRTVADRPTLYRLLRRAFQLSRTLPDELLQTFKQETSALPRGTEAERLVVQRIGQGIFRQGLLEFWDGRCAITGLAVPELLRASHIKPWSACVTDAERLDVFNGLLLGAHLDAAFDQGLITVMDDGEVSAAYALDLDSREWLGLKVARRVAVSEGHRPYLDWHRKHLFRRAT
jgi:hypothetical protein